MGALHLLSCGPLIITVMSRDCAACKRKGTATVKCNNPTCGILLPSGIIEPHRFCDEICAKSHARDSYIGEEIHIDASMRNLLTGWNKVHQELKKMLIRTAGLRIAKVAGGDTHDAGLLVNKYNGQRASAKSHKNTDVTSEIADVADALLRPGAEAALLSKANMTVGTVARLMGAYGGAGTVKKGLHAALKKFRGLRAKKGADPTPTSDLANSSLIEAAAQPWLLMLIGHATGDQGDTMHMEDLADKLAQAFAPDRAKAKSNYSKVLANLNVMHDAIVGALDAFTTVDADSVKALFDFAETKLKNLPHPLKGTRSMSIGDDVRVEGDDDTAHTDHPTTADRSGYAEYHKELTDASFYTAADPVGARVDAEDDTSRYYM